GTVNVSRGGLLVPCQEAHAEGTSLWVTFPYDAAVPYGQPEILARVVRSAASDVGVDVNGDGDGSAAVNVAGLTRATRTTTADKNSTASATLRSGTGRGRS